LLRIHVLMAEQRMTQKELSEATGIRANTLSAYYHNTWKTIKRDHLLAFSKVFNCSVRDLFEVES